MDIKDSFTVAATPVKVWNLLLDVERIAPCMPGAELTEVVDEQTWKGRVRMRLGPVTMNYAGEVVVVERDDENMRVTLRAQAAELSGKGNASATVRADVVGTPDGGSHVSIVQTLALSGVAAQFGGRMIGDVSAQLTKQFAGCLSAKLGGSGPQEAPPVQEIRAFRLAAWAFFRAVGRLLRWPRSRKPTADEGTTR
jgi:carbon monoxide dehydrogenase subunit G